MIDPAGKNTSNLAIEPSVNSSTPSIVTDFLFGAGCAGLGLSG
jgi:hypothetical protein